MLATSWLSPWPSSSKSEIKLHGTGENGNHQERQMQKKELTANEQKEVPAHLGALTVVFVNIHVP